MPNHKFKEDIVGKVFGYWTVIQLSPEKDKRNCVQYECVCKCGKKAFQRKATLVSGRTLGCYVCRNHHTLKKERNNLTL